jgi:hypothetical protein
MTKTKKLLKNGRKQVQPHHAQSWDDLFAFASTIEIPCDFLRKRDRRAPKKSRI